MDGSTIVKFLIINVVAAAILYSRFSDTPAGVELNLKAQSILSTVWKAGPEACGIVKWSQYTVVSNRVVLPNGTGPAAVHVVNGSISSISQDINVRGPRVLYFKDAVVMPGVIDVHVHFNEPGREEWEGITTGTKAAAAGGITTVIDMPLNSDPTTTIPTRLFKKQHLAKLKSHVSMGHWAGLVPGNAKDHNTLQALVSGGAVGFKAFMCPSGINDFEHVTGEDIAAALPFFRRVGVPLMLHAEVVSDMPAPTADPTVYSTYMHTRPPKFERDAIKLIIELLNNATSPASEGFVIHIAHLADAGALDMIKHGYLCNFLLRQAAQDKGHPIMVETCAHYLQFNSDMIPDKATWYKCAPPLRGADYQQALVKAVAGGDIGIVSSDHSPAPPSMKQMDTGNFLKAWGGISGVQYLLPATWTALKDEPNFNLARLSSVLSGQPAVLVGMDGHKGKIAVGYDADLAVFHPDELADTSTAGNQHKHKTTPYADMKLYGKMVATIVKGQFVYLYGQHAAQVCGGPVVQQGI